MTTRERSNRGRWLKTALQYVIPLLLVGILQAYLQNRKAEEQVAQNRKTAGAFSSHMADARPHSVTYRVTGSAANVTISYDGPGMAAREAKASTLPWTVTFDAANGALLSLDAVEDGPAAFTAEIEVDGKSVARSASRPDPTSADGGQSAEGTDVL